MTDTKVQLSLDSTGEPVGDLCIRTLAMPADTNANGDIFGGWLLSQMDVGGGVFASKLARSRTVTVAIEAMNFRKTRAVRKQCNAAKDKVQIKLSS